LYASSCGFRIPECLEIRTKPTLALASSKDLKPSASFAIPRNGGNTRHHLGEILFIAFAGVLCGVRSCEMMEKFAGLETRDQFAFAVRQLDAARLDAQRWSFARTKDSGHDRSEVREILVCHNLVRLEGDNPKRPKRPPKCELRATLGPSCLERLLSPM
jgi:hypothetical protein